MSNRKTCKTLAEVRHRRYECCRREMKTLVPSTVLRFVRFLASEKVRFECRFGRSVGFTELQLQEHLLDSSQSRERLKTETPSVKF